MLLQNQQGCNFYASHCREGSDQIRSDIGLLRVDKRNSTTDSRNDTRTNVNNYRPNFCMLTTIKHTTSLSWLYYDFKQHSVHEII